MNYIYQLKFTSKESFEELLTYSEVDKDSNVITKQEEWLKDVETIVEVGVIVKAATFDEEGNELTPEKIVDGWHVDLLGHALITELQPYCLDSAPTTPVHGTGWAENDYMIVTKETYATDIP